MLQLLSPCMVNQVGWHQKLTHNDLTAYALKVTFSTLDVIGNRLILQHRLFFKDRQHLEVSYGPHIKQRMNIVSPSGAPPHPIVIYFHGGGWLIGDKNGYSAVCKRFAESGYLTFSANYRLAPSYRYAAQLQDVATAIRWVYEHAAQYGGDSRAIFLAGDSAGALLASWYANALHKRELFDLIRATKAIPKECILGVLLFYGVYDLQTARVSGFPFIKTYISSFLGSGELPLGIKARFLSPISHLVHDGPPIFICASERDALFTQSVQYAEAIKQHRRQPWTLFFSLKDHPEATHGFLYFLNKRCTQMALREALRFLTHYTHQPTAKQHRQSMAKV